VPELSALSITKDYAATRALDGVSLSFRGGEVHAVIGENGAGKSTLMKILAGIVRPDAGSLRLDGREVSFRSVREANRAGVALIHQELNLVDDLDVAGNVFLGQERTRGGFLDRAAMRRQAAELLGEVGATIDPRAIVRELPVASRQLVEIAKAIALDARFLLMDEPTAVLSERETRSLFALIRRLREKGVGIVYISHLLPEVRAISDRVSVLRDGRLVAELDPKVASETELATAMVGRAMDEVFPTRKRPEAVSSALDVTGLRSGSAVRDVSISVAPGEILGLAGLVGSGRTETAEAICGLRKVDAGEIPGYVALVARRGKVAGHVQAWVVPGSVGVKRAAEALQY
jgi:ribose transport system ATP-binding protein